MQAAWKPAVAPEVTRISASGSACHAVVAREFGGDGLAQALDAIHAGVDIEALLNGFDGARNDGRRNAGVAYALGKIDAARQIAGHGHGANLGLNQPGRNFAEVQFLGNGTHWSRLPQSAVGG